MNRSMRKHSLYGTAIAVMIFFLAACTRPAQQSSGETMASADMEKNFKSPPDSVKPWMYWYWLSDNISAKGISADLATMAKVGVGEAFIGNIGLPETPYGKVPVLSDQWWQLTKHAVHEGQRLGVNIGIFNSPGWSQSGGPWIKPEEAMRYLVSKTWMVAGGKKISQKLEVPYQHFQDVAVLAFPASKEEAFNLASLHPQIKSTPQLSNTTALADNDTATAVVLPAKDSVVIDLHTDQPFDARSLSLYPGKQPFAADFELLAKAGDAGGYTLVRSFNLDRSNPNLNVGPMPFGPVCIAFPKVHAADFRLVVKNMHNAAALAEIQLSPAPRLERYVEKELGKMHQTPHPMWDAYLWPEQAATQDTAALPAASDVRVISQYLSPDGTLNWEAPAGNWIIERIGMTTTGVTNAPAAPEATGLEVDKMSSQALKDHFNAFIGRILDSLPAADRPAFHHVVADSYETGSENWTDGMADDFRKRYGYDPIPWLPVLSGHIIGSADQSDRFLWDLRRLIADRIAYQYVGGLRKISEDHGLRIWLENYGHWGFPSEFLMYGGQSDDIAGEFWAEGDLGSIEVRAAASAAHIYGKNQVWAESFTAGGQAFLRYPDMLKKRGDWSFAEGVNHTLLHVYIEQAYDSMPGVNTGFGTEFNRYNTWFGESKTWIDYLRRCMFMLQRGKPVADVCYFIGEDAPKMTGIRQPEIPKGYNYDYINAEVIENRLSVKDGKLVLPDGVSYSLMVLPPQTSMRPALLKKISELVADGATILGPRPDKSPSLQDYPAADKEVQEMAAKLWQNCDGKTVKAVQYGKGRVLDGMDLQAAFDKLKVPADFNVNGTAPVLYMHRAMADADIYFMTNQSDSTLNIRPTFRSEGQPELWDAVTGNIRQLPEYDQQNGLTTVPLKLLPAQSWFVVFKKNITGSQANKDGQNFPESKEWLQLPGPWQVSFDQKMRGPAQAVTFDKLSDWSQNTNDSIRYYSGSAVYHTTFRVDSIPAGKQLSLSLGHVKVMAFVKLNGQDLGGVWTEPWSVDISKAIRKGENELEIKVINLWVNRLIGDSKLPPAQRKTWAPVQPYTPNSPLQPSGLLGPVTVQMSDR